MNIEVIAKYGDALAVIGFALLIYYMYNKEKRTLIENLLLLFGMIGFVVDLSLTLKRFVL